RSPSPGRGRRCSRCGCRAAPHAPAPSPRPGPGHRTSPRTPPALRFPVCRSTWYLRAPGGPSRAQAGARNVRRQDGLRGRGAPSWSQAARAAPPRTTAPNGSPSRLAVDLDLYGRNRDDSSNAVENLPMSVSSKCYYAIRAIYALAEHGGPEPMKIADIAEKEKIPIRFLEVILSQLKSKGFVRSRRGAEGGDFLARSPEELTVGEGMRFVAGPIAPVDCVSQSRPKECQFHGD